MDFGWFWMIHDERLKVLKGWLKVHDGFTSQHLLVVYCHAEWHLRSFLGSRFLGPFNKKSVLGAELVDFKLRRNYLFAWNAAANAWVKFKMLPDLEHFRELKLMNFSVSITLSLYAKWTFIYRLLKDVFRCALLSLYVYAWSCARQSRAFVCVLYLFVFCVLWVLGGWCMFRCVTCPSFLWLQSWEEPGCVTPMMVTLIVSQFCHFGWFVTVEVG